MTPSGKNYIAGRRSAAGTDTFRAVNPADGSELPVEFHHAVAEELDEAVRAAAEATEAARRLAPSRRAALLRSIAKEIDDLGDELISRGTLETGLPAARLVSERGRTTGQLAMFADLIDEGSWVDARIDTALPDRAPAPKPDLRRMLMPIGPVAVFCASNFPLAFSVAGGDTASALAAGCGVVVKAHSSHPGTAELVASAVTRAIASEGMPAGLFSLIHGPGTTVGVALIRHPLLRAAGFTGSHSGGRALFDAAASRKEPIPVYAEMGSTNPVFILPGALASRREEIAEGLKNSVTLGVGQFCTNPGLVVGLASPALASFAREAGSRFSAAEAGIMLNAKIGAAYRAGVDRVKSVTGVQVAGESETGKADGAGARSTGAAATLGSPAIFTTDASTFLADEALSGEVFGPATILVEGSSREELLRVAEAMEGHLTATIHGTEKDLEEYGDLVALLERKVGRLIFNGFPTGVEVCPSMNHGGPYPATTDSHFTSVGTAAVYRFARPICYQGFPDSRLPDALRNSNPLGLMRTVNGRLTREAIGER
jgi:2,5-dioxopentanoate dehydrogenase